jgi:hypothetical protein
MDCLLRKGNKIHRKGHSILRPYFSPFPKRIDRTQNYPLAGLIYLFSFAFFSLSFCGSDRNSGFYPFLITTEILVNRKGMVVN